MTRPVAALADATGHGDRAALARLLTVVESGGDAARDALAALPWPRRRGRRGRRHHRRAGCREVDAHRRPRRARSAAPATGWRCSRSTPRAPSPAAPSSVTASACRITTPTTTCSSARWRRAASIGGLSRADAAGGARARRRRVRVDPGRDGRGRPGGGRDRRHRRHDDRRRHPGLGRRRSRRARRACSRSATSSWSTRPTGAGSTPPSAISRACSCSASTRDWSPPMRRDGRHRGPRRRRARRRDRRRIGAIWRRPGELAERRELRVSGRIARHWCLSGLAKQADDFCSGPRFDSVVRQVADGASIHTLRRRTWSQTPTQRKGMSVGIERVGRRRRRAHGRGDRRGLRPRPEPT